MRIDVGCATVRVYCGSSGNNYYFEDANWNSTAVGTLQIVEDCEPAKARLLAEFAKGLWTFATFQAENGDDL